MYLMVHKVRFLRNKMTFLNFKVIPCQFYTLDL